MPTNYQRATPEQLAQMRALHEARQAEYARVVNPNNVPVPGPGFYAGPIYFTDDGRRFVAPEGAHQAGGRFLEHDPFGWDDVAEIGSVIGFPIAAVSMIDQIRRGMGGSGGSGGTGGGTAPELPRQVQPGTGNGSGSGSNVGSGVDWTQLATAIGSLAPLLLGGMRGGNGGGTVDPLLAGLVPDMQALFRHQLGRMQATDPLFGQTMNMVSRRLPTWSRGNFGPLTASGTAATPAASSPTATSPPAGRSPNVPRSPNATPVPGRAVPRPPEMPPPSTDYGVADAGTLSTLSPHERIMAAARTQKVHEDHTRTTGKLPTPPPDLQTIVRLLAQIRRPTALGGI